MDYKPMSVDQIRFRTIVGEMADLHEKKSSDYGDSFGISVRKYGMIAALTRISDKFNRIENLILHPDKEVKNESLKDSLIDMACYAVLTLIELQKKDDKLTTLNREFVDACMNDLFKINYDPFTFFKMPKDAKIVADDAEASKVGEVVDMENDVTADALRNMSGTIPKQPIPDEHSPNATSNVRLCLLAIGDCLRKYNVSFSTPSKLEAFDNETNEKAPVNLETLGF